MALKMLPRMAGCYYLVAALTVFRLGSASTNSTKIYLLGLFPMSGSWAGGQAVKPAAELAVQDINANPEILPGYELAIISKDTQCDGGVATDVMYRELYNTTTTKVMIIGDGCSVATEPTAQASHHWNLIQISYSSSSPKLSKREIFPRFFRLLSGESVYNAVKFGMFRKFNWRKVAIVHQSVPLFAEAVTDFHKNAPKHDIEIIAMESFLDDPSTQVRKIKELDARIIIGGFYGDMARKVFCEAYRQKLYGDKYVWIVPGWLGAGWWRQPDDSINCTQQEMDVAASNHFDINIDSLPLDSYRGRTVSGMNTSGFLDKYSEYTKKGNLESLTGYSRISLGYDSVWTAALALHKAQRQLSMKDPPRSLEDFCYDKATSQIFFNIISNLTFEGISGPIKFAPNGDRVGLLNIRQIQDGKGVTVGIMNPLNGSSKDIIFEGFPLIIWKDGVPPVDSVIVTVSWLNIYLPLFITGATLSIFGIILACCFLVFNILFRKRRVIKMSSPNINNLILIGGILAYLSIIFLGVDSEETFVFMCKAKTWLLSVGFSLAFGSMFSKTWRVHKIFTHKKVTRMVIKDYRLVSWVASLVLLDVIILVLWEVFDPVEAILYEIEKVPERDNDDKVYIEKHLSCQSIYQIYFIGAFYVIDGLLLVFGAFLAWETRKVSIPALNDSKYIGFCVYNVMLLSFLGATVSSVIVEQNANFAFVASLIWVSTTLTLGVIFIPKIKMRNDVRPTQSDIRTVVSQNNAFTDSQKEMQQLRRDFLRMRTNCTCSANRGQRNRRLVKSKSEGAPVTDGVSEDHISFSKHQQYIQSCSGDDIDVPLE